MLLAVLGLGFLVLCVVLLAVSVYYVRAQAKTSTEEEYDVLSLCQNTRLSLQYLNLETIPPTVQDMTFLQTLSLTKNVLSQHSFQGINFATMTALSALHLDDNVITELPQTFHYLPPSVTALTISSNHLHEIDFSRISHLTNLQTLILSRNVIQLLTPKLGELKNLTELDLSRNHLRSIPKELEDVHSLAVLNLEENKLKTIGVDFSHFGNLQQLNLQNNRLRFLPKSIGSLVHLKSLFLENNLISRFCDDFFFGFSSLTLLSLSHNKLESLPTSISRLTTLLFLDSNSNPIHHVEDWFFKLTQLLKLELMDTKIQFIPKLSSLKNLQSLKISTKLREFSFSLSNFPHMYSLNLRKNKYLFRVDESFFHLETSFCHHVPIEIYKNRIFVSPTITPPSKITLDGLHVTHILQVGKRPPSYPSAFQYFTVPEGFSKNVGSYKNDTLFQVLCWVDEVMKMEAVVFIHSYGFLLEVVIIAVELKIHFGTNFMNAIKEIQALIPSVDYSTLKSKFT
eukprot:TRINITY_DN2470_c0_g1_i10.p1 TRINITY_DN2470_c0_g1~~TRINITY_DN2470_c0_g1_i10.p1  ORF type:complete len:511 (+),score=91.25 TRINITY_DN2470_c0_g1_i10:106-1638(+)